MTSCPDCSDGVEHCHATLVAHADGTLECLAGAACELDRDAHGLVIECAEVQPACGCAATGAEPAVA